MNQITIYRRTDSNTTPRGFGNQPTYHIDEPYSSDAEMIWVEPIQITLPDGYTVAESMGAYRFLYDQNDQVVPILDDHGHPALYIGDGINKQGKKFSRYLRLDK